MTTANLRILDEYDADKANNFELFADDLALWATQYVPEISCKVAQYADELFDVLAVRILLGKWKAAYKLNRKHQRECFTEIANNGRKDIGAEDFDSLYRTDQNAYNTALYALVIEA